MEWMNAFWLWVTDNHQLDIVFRLFLAALLGGLVGIEREQNNHPAGFRTHILVCVGSALIMLISMYGFTEFIEENRDWVLADPGRIAAQVVSGIGFLGAGTIIVHGATVRGLTTAASLWVVAGIGLALGAGFYLGAVLTTIIVLISLIVLNRIESAYIKKSRMQEVTVKMSDSPGKLASISSRLEEKKILIRNITLRNGAKIAGDDALYATFLLRIPPKASIAEVIEQLSDIEGVEEVSLQ